MRKIVVSAMNLAQSRQSKRNGCNHNTQRRYGRELKCAKCQKELRVGDVAFRTVGHYLCQECGENSEIDTD